MCSRLGMKDHHHQECYARSCREIEELKRCCYQEETYLKTTKIGNISCAAWLGITNSESIFYEQEEKAAPSIRRTGTQQHPTGATETATLLELTFLMFFQTKISYIFLSSIYLPKKREVRHHHAKKRMEETTTTPQGWREESTTPQTERGKEQCQPKGEASPASHTESAGKHHHHHHTTEEGITTPRIHTTPLHTTPHDTNTPRHRLIFRK